MNTCDAIYRILRYLEMAMDYDEPDLDCISAKAIGITENRWKLIMEQLASHGYITGVAVERPMVGAITITKYNPRITISGLEFLSENSVMKKARRRRMLPWRLRQSSNST